MKWNGIHFLHKCQNIVDNYGPQVVVKGSSCPFCGEAAPEPNESAQPKAEAESGPLGECKG